MLRATMASLNRFAGLNPCRPQLVHALCCMTAEQDPSFVSPLFEKPVNGPTGFCPVNLNARNGKSSSMLSTKFPAFNHAQHAHPQAVLIASR